MIDKVCLTAEYINGLKSERYSSLDPTLLEKTFRALVLLEVIVSSGVPFIFKGGTALMLLTQEPKRLSIDLDIIIEDVNFDAKEWLDSIVGNDFDRVEESERTHPNLPAKHFKVFYASAIQTRSQIHSSHIIVDVLFQENPYSTLIDSHITIPALKHTLVPITVKTPDLQAILPDKLSAFAPNTTGVPYFKNGSSSSLEVIKQLHDVALIFQKIGSSLDFKVVKKSYQDFSNLELKYRLKEGLTYLDCLKDTLNTCLSICSRGSLGDRENYPHLESGIRSFRNYTFEGQYTIENAQEDATLVAWLTTCLMLEDFSKVIYPGTDKNQRLSANSPFNILNKQFKKSNPELLCYWDAIGKMLTSLQLPNNSPPSSKLSQQ